ncbi:MAG: phenyltransferase domain-containing protein [Desulfatibacillaceae bacterium]
MESNLFPKTEPTCAIDVARMAEAICSVQKSDGEIPWSEGGKTDPWDHVESAMGLSVAGFHKEARTAYAWSAAHQMPDGSFYASYRDGVPDERRKDPNMTSYVAVGVWHHYLVTGDLVFLREMWPTVEAAIDFTIGLQAPEGQICWSMDDDGNVEERALLTGSASMYLSIRCAAAIAARLGRSRPKWEFAARKLREAVRRRPDLFDMSKSRYSMDWYYPVLCGAVRGREADARFAEGWDSFVVEHWGVRCVSDRPWVTMAETAECVLALCAAGRTAEAERLFDWLRDCRYEDGFHWMGITCPDSVIWPEDRTAWTTAAVILAGDSLFGWTAGANIFSHAYWDGGANRSKADGDKLVTAVA